MVLALLILLLLRAPLRRLPFSRNGSFYSAAALIFLFLDIIVLAIVNISFTYYFLWAFIFALLFAVTPSKPLKLVCFLLSPYWLLKTLVELFAQPSLEFCRFVLLSPLEGNMLLTTALLPFVLMLIRIDMVLPSFSRIRRGTRIRLATSLLTIFLAGLFVSFLLYAPYNELNRQPAVAENTVDLAAKSSVLSLSSPAPLGRIEVRDHGRPLLVDTTSSRYRTPLPLLPAAPPVGVSTTGFLDRRNVVLRFQPESAPYQVRLNLSSQEAFVIYDANFPYVRSPEGKRYDLLIGKNPPVPLQVQLTLPRGGRYELEVVLEYRSLPPTLEVRGEHLRLQSRHTVREKIDLRT
jgi:hypothetical protein